MRRTLTAPLARPDHLRLDTALFLALLACLLFVLTGADAWTTHTDAVRLGPRFAELNPVMSFALAHLGWSGFLAVKFGASAAYVVAVRLLGGAVGTMRWALLLAIVAEGTFAALNLHLLLS